MFFKDSYRPIPPTYNLVLAMLWRHPENIDLGRTKVVHYCAAVSIITKSELIPFCTVVNTHKSELQIQGSKPWRYTGTEENMGRADIKMLVEKWWDIYNDESLDYRNFSGNGQPFMAALSEAGEVHCIPAPSAA